LKIADIWLRIFRLGRRREWKSMQPLLDSYGPDSGQAKLSPLREEVQLQAKSCRHVDQPRRSDNQRYFPIMSYILNESQPRCHPASASSQDGLQPVYPPE
jgi:hypothetical protein